MDNRTATALTRQGIDTTTSIENLEELVIDEAVSLRNAAQTWADHPSFNTAKALKDRSLMLNGMRTLVLRAYGYKTLNPDVDKAIEQANMAIGAGMARHRR